MIEGGFGGKSSNIFVANIANLFKTKNIDEILNIKYYNLLLYPLENKKFLYEDSLILDKIIEKKFPDGTHILNNKKDYEKNKFLFNQLFFLILEKFIEELNEINTVEKIKSKNIESKDYELDVTIEKINDTTFHEELQNIIKKYGDIFKFNVKY